MNSNGITVELEELLQKLTLMQEDGCDYATLEVCMDGYDSELFISGHNPDSDEPIEYGILPSVNDMDQM